MQLGEIIHAYRKTNDLTMQQFADRAGLSKAYISMLEKNKHPQSKRALIPSIETCAKISDAIGVSLDELMSMLDGNQYVNLSSNKDDVILHLFHELNDEGKSKLIDNAEDLVATGRYSKEDL